MHPQSDISAFVELPDGKVVSGTESGSLLLWEGNFIKCRFVQISGALCHQGEVTHVSLDRKERIVITAGLDGVIRCWDFDAMDTAEVDAGAVCVCCSHVYVVGVCVYVPFYNGSLVERRTDLYTLPE